METGDRFPAAGGGPGRVPGALDPETFLATFSVTPPPPRPPDPPPPPLHRRILPALRYRATPKWSYVDIAPRADRAVLITGSGRSGSTWVMEALNFDGRYRIVFEPFRELSTAIARDIPYRYLPPTREEPRIEGACRIILSGRLRTGWSDALNKRRIASRRLVKEIRIANLLPWLSNHFPEVPVIHLVRHPLAVAESRQFLNPKQEILYNWWTVEPFVRHPELIEGPLAPFVDVIAANAENPDWLRRFTLRWCMENYVALAMADSHLALIAFYEDLVIDPRTEFERLLRHLGRPFEDRMLPGLGSLSAHANPRRRKLDSIDHLSGWQRRLEPAQRRELLEIVDAFGLGHLYGDHPTPRLKPEDLRRAGGA